MKEIDVIDPLSEEEIQVQARLIEQIKQGMEFAHKSYFMIIDGLRKVKELKLYREVGSLRDWALMHFGFGEREYNYYLKAGEVIENIRSVDPDANPRLTHALAIGMVEPDDQPALWEKVKESGQEITKKLILATAKNLEMSGEIRAREGVKIKSETEDDYLLSRIHTAWLSVTEESKPVAIADIFARESSSFINVVIHLAQQELMKRDERYTE